MEGVLAVWDAVTKQPGSQFLAHTRPVSAIRFAPGGALLATASWDRQVVLRKADKERDGRVLSGHEDIVAGCAFSADGGLLLTWSHDGTARLWETDTGREAARLAGHEDRVTAAALSPDGRWAATGGRDGALKLWDLTAVAEAATRSLPAEVRVCFFLLDGRTLFVADADGRLWLLAAPGLDVRFEGEVGRKVLTGDLAPSGGALALGCEDGRPALLAVEGLEEAPLLVTATLETRHEPASLLGRLFGRAGRTRRVYQYTCPSCRRAIQRATLPPGPVLCPGCGRRLHVQAPGMVQLTAP
jgi:WD40 repeat protein